MKALPFEEILLVRAYCATKGHGFLGDLIEGPDGTELRDGWSETVPTDSPPAVPTTSTGRRVAITRYRSIPVDLEALTTLSVRCPNCGPREIAGDAVREAVTRSRRSKAVPKLLLTAPTVR